jgi:hypothetical protein
MSTCHHLFDLITMIITTRMTKTAMTTATDDDDDDYNADDR